MGLILFALTGNPDGNGIVMPSGTATALQRHMDFSQLDLFLGLVIGIAATGIITGLVIWALIRAKVFNLGAPVVVSTQAAGNCDGSPAEHLVRIQIPRDCNEHRAEKDRSKRNEAEIDKLWSEYGKLRAEAATEREKLRGEMSSGFKEVTSTITSMQTQILGALAGERRGFGSPGRGGGE